jgi:histone acetyltransferase (RNA polymerase elongator complex component)
MTMTKADISQREKPLVIPIFIMNSGCPGRCTFCNQKIAAGNFAPRVTKSFFDAEVASYLRWNKDKLREVEIAFYGGNFTGLSPEDQEQLLDWAGEYLSKRRIQSIRISTRPDYVDDDQLNYLKSRGVGAIELGAQSFNDEALKMSGRGHDAQTTIHAVKLIKAHGFKTGLHLMAGLPCDSRESFLMSLEQTALLKPDTARIHPVLVFADTPLACDYRLGRYQPLSLHEAVFWCLLAWETLAPAGIRIIRFGLQLTPEMNREGAIIAGPLHPAFGSLVYSAVYYSCTLKLLADIPKQAGELRFTVDQRDLSNFRGHKNRNMEAIKKLYPDAHIIVESAHSGIQGQITLKIETGETFRLTIPGIL